MESPGADHLQWLPSGEMSNIIRAKDWSQTALGPIESWPIDLRTTVSLCLASNFPINISWGPKHEQIYNDAYREVIGAAHPRALGESYRITWHSAWPAVGEAFESALNGEPRFLQNERMFLERNGYCEETFFTFSISPIRDLEGNVLGLFIPVSETTERMLAERRLRALRDVANAAGKGKSAIEASDCAVMALRDHTLDVPFAAIYLTNDDGSAFVRQTSYGASGTLLPDEFSPSVALEAIEGKFREDVRQHFGDHVCGEYPDPIERAYLTTLVSSGSEKPIGLLWAGLSPRLPFNDSYRTFFEMLRKSVNNALNDARAFEEERRRAEALRDIDRAKTAFFSNVSHEFRTPLTLMLGPLADCLAAGESSLSAENRRRVDFAYRNTLRLAKLVNLLLDFSRIEAGRMRAKFKPLDATQLTLDIASVFRSAVEQAGLKFEINVNRLDEPAYLDRDMWEKVILNLLSNALKFTFKGNITVTLAQREHEMEFSVRDTGIGVATEELPNLFKRFHRIESARGRSHEGSGIGLALVQDLVFMHGGTITATSTLGVGSEFCVRIPLGQAHLPADQVSSDPNMASENSGLSESFVEEARRWLPDAGPKRVRAKSNATILLVDDNSDMREYVAGLLSPHWRVLSVGDGEAALKLAREAAPDLILSDVMMPKLDGFGLLAAIRADERLKTTPVIFVSARADEQSSNEGRKAGADDYLIKPFTATELLARVHTQIKLARLRRGSEQAREEIYFRALIDGAPTMLYLTDVRGASTYRSQRWFEFTKNFGPEDTGFAWLENIHPDDRPAVRAQFDSAVGKQEEFKIDYRLLRHDGVARWVCDHASPRFGPMGEFLGHVGSVVDVHERKEVERSLAVAVEEAELANQAKTRFLANMSHEIRTPLGIIQGFAELALDSLTSAEDRGQFLNTIRRNSLNLTKMLGEILDLSKIEAGKIEIEKIRFSLPSLIEEVMSLLTLQAQSKALSLRFESVGQVPEYIHSDPTRLRQILINLIGNAIKFTPKGEVRVTVRRCTDHGLEFVIDDTGIGLSHEQSSRLFEPFSQADNSMNRRYGGTGLGLTLSRRLAQALGGDLALTRSAPGEGSTFTFTIVGAESHLNTALMHAQNPKRQTGHGEVDARSAGRLQGWRILLVEDSLDNQFLISRYLTQEGAQVEVAGDGREGLRKVRQIQYDLIVMDIQMPRMDGYEAIREIRQLDSEIPILALTAHALSEERERALSCGFNDYLTKPLNRGLLIETLQKHRSV